MIDDDNLVGVPVTDRGTWMQLGGGRRFYPLDPRPEEVFIEDIAQSLSRQIRYNGLSDKIIVVGQHSVNVSWMADYEDRSPEVQLALLMHDAAETYVSDMIRPLKVNFPGFRKVEDNVMSVINAALRLPIISHELIKHYDNLALSWEKRDMYPSAEEWPNMLPVPEWCPTMETWTSKFTEARFLSLYEWLCREITYG